MSLYNDVVRRPHLPREHGIRRLLLDTNVDLTLYGPCPEDEGEEADDDALEYEESEEEHMEDDPCPLASGLETAACLYQNISSQYYCTNNQGCEDEEVAPEATPGESNLDSTEPRAK